MKITIFLILTMFINTFALAVDNSQVPKGLEKGDQVGTFEAIGDDGKLWKSSDVIGKDFLVIYFYPAAMTGGCTAQACSFRDDKAELNKIGAQVVGVSGDQVESLKYFKIAENLNFTLLSDVDGKIAKLFGVPIKNGGEIKRTVQGKDVTLKRDISTSRWTFIVGKDGRIIYKNTNVKAAEDGDTVVAFLKEYKTKDKA